MLRKNKLCVISFSIEVHVVSNVSVIYARKEILNWIFITIVTRIRGIGEYMSTISLLKWRPDFSTSHRHVQKDKTIPISSWFSAHVTFSTLIMHRVDIIWCMTSLSLMLRTYRVTGSTGDYRKCCVKDCRATHVNGRVKKWTCQELPTSRFHTIPKLAHFQK